MVDDEYVRRGDFWVKKSHLERARDTFEERSPRSRATDRALRAPVTSNIEQYERAEGRGVDFPGVDTPTDEPRQDISDFPFPRERREMARRGGAGGVELADTERGSLFEGAADTVEKMNEQSGWLRDVLGL